jgi:hypothetical protein
VQWLRSRIPRQIMKNNNDNDKNMVVGGDGFDKWKSSM